VSPSPVIVLDTVLLILLVVGATNPALIARHKRLRAYTAEDFVLLQNVLMQSSGVVVTPNILSETSNLLSHIDEPARSEAFLTFGRFIQENSEQFVSSRTAVQESEFIRLGLTDVVSLVTTQPPHHLLTDDLDLYLAALNRGREASNFNHIRAAAEGL
jgi:hypothetical protein